MRILCLLLAWASISVEGATVIGIGRSSGDAGGVTVTPISLASDRPIVGIQIDLGYNPSQVDIGTVVKGSVLGSAFLVGGSEIEPGRYRIVLYSESNAKLANGSVLEIPLSFNETVAAGQRGIELLEIQLADASGLSRNYQLAPFVEIIQPGLSSEYQLGSSVLVEVEAFASTGSLQGVSLYVDGELTESDSTEPYRFNWSPQKRGRVELLVVATDSTDVQAEASRALQILSNFDNWSRDNFPVEQLENPFYAGYSADPDLDGRVNGIEYLTNSNPLSATEGAPMESGLIQIGGLNYLTLTFEVPDTVNDVSYGVYGSSDVNPGNLANAVEALLIEETVISEGVSRRTYRDPEPFGSGSRFMFIRSTLGTE
jgi:hypothetical protein